MFKAVYFHRTVRAAELMLAHSMAGGRRAGVDRHLKIDAYLRLTDEIVATAPMSFPAEPELRLARKLAENYNNRKLVKCVFEKVMQRKDRTSRGSSARRDSGTSSIGHSQKADVRRDESTWTCPPRRLSPTRTRGRL